MDIHELFLKVVNDIGDAYGEHDGEAVHTPLEYRTDGCNSVICFCGSVVIQDSEWCWDGEEEGSERYGKTEYECLVEDVLEELEDIYTALGALLAAGRGMAAEK